MKPFLQKKKKGASVNKKINESVVNSEYRKKEGEGKSYQFISASFNRATAQNRVLRRNPKFLRITTLF